MSGLRIGLVGLGLVFASAACAGEWPALPVAVSNNATAALSVEGELRLYSFSGLLAGKTWRDVTDRAFEFRAGEGRWRELPRVPGGEGRLASVAAAVAGRIYLFGGYTVAEDGSERSLPLVHRFDPGSGEYRAMAPMPVPVDDAVAAAWQDRYVILVSGWHDTDNVANVQLYDTAMDRWQQATPWPGPPLFGHAGGRVGDALIVCDGVKVVPLEEPGKREFRISDACFRGELDRQDPTHIDWRPLPAHPGSPRYRMAATGHDASGQVLFAGGSGNPYNYDGIGYDDRPSRPETSVFAWDEASGQWVERPALQAASMDHRNLPVLAGQALLLGGMGEDQQVLDRIQVYSLGDR